MAIRPDELPRWANVVFNNGPNNEANVSEPTDLKKDRGWDWDERPPREFFNWLHLKTYEWLDYHRELLDSAGQIVTNFSLNEDTTSGLTLGLLSGRVNTASGLVEIAASTYALTDNTVNRVYINLDTSAILATTGAFPTEDYIPLYEVTTSAGEITSQVDLRTWAQHPAQLIQNPSTFVDLQPSQLDIQLNGTLSLQSTSSTLAAPRGVPGSSGYVFTTDGDTGMTSLGDKLAFFLGGTAAVMYYSTTGLGVNVDPLHTFHAAANNSEFYYSSTGVGELVQGATNFRASGVLSAFLSTGKNSISSDIAYSRWQTVITNATNGVEDGNLQMLTQRNGTETLWATFGTNLGETYGTQFQEALTIEDLGGNTPYFKMTSSLLGSTNDGFQIRPDFTANLTSIIGYDTDAISVLPGNVQTMYATSDGRVGFGGNTSPLESIHSTGNIRSDAIGMAAASIEAHQGVSSVSLRNNTTDVGLEDSIGGDLITRNKSTGKVFIDGPVGVNTTDAQYDLEVNGTFSAQRMAGGDYPETSTSGTTSIVDTGIIPQGGEVYEIIVTGNPNSPGNANYRSTIHLYAYVTVGNVGATINKYVNTVEKFSVSGLHDTGGSEIQASVSFWDGATDSDVFVQTDNPELRVKVSGYNVGSVGANQQVKVKRIN